MRPRLLWVSIFLVGIILGIFLTKWLFILSGLVLIILGIDHGDSSKDAFLLFKLHPLKTIYSEYGKFYLYVRISEGYNCSTTYAYLYVDKIWGYKRITDFSFNGLEDLKSRTNEFLDSHYGYVKKQMDFRNKVRDDIFENWNGVTTKQLDRDKKLEELI
jgi:hypothetical protein